MNPHSATPADFIEHVAQVSAGIGRRPLDAALETWLNERFRAGGDWYAQMLDMCRRGCDEGWLCGREAGGIRFGRAVPVTEQTHGMSVDVVEMADVVGPHHTHPNGEIDLVMPLDGDALFDGRGAGWKVYLPGSAHRPTVTQGRALILYLLPEGAIEFSRS